jgi:hypothetical protein
MSRWFRHYAGMMRDDKLVRVSIRSNQTIERVLWVWGAILESAAEIDDHGRFDVDAAEIAYFLRADEADISVIFSALADAGRVADGAVVHWGDRQFLSDRSAARVAAHRERKRAQVGEGNDKAQDGNGVVTLQERHGNSPETETETYIPVANATGAGAPSDKQFWDTATAYLGGKRSLIGKWCKDYGKPETASAITTAQLERPVEPIAFIEATLRRNARAGPKIVAVGV